MSRWDWLEGVKAESPSRVAVRELCKLMVKELGAWPPELSWGESQVSTNGQELFDEQAPQQLPSPTAIAEASKRLRWEFERNMEASDYYLRNRLLEKACEGRKDYLASEFLFEYLREGFFELMERTEGRIRRADILEGLDELEVLLGHMFSPIEPLL